ncbi:unnamed protein product [Calicophoron daubneyi]|uniref:EF-hand domain-containing protein n=1 Tax=Calicophoron daubneyi TaxID=300641 RepID=A0AAV2T0E7_CALDB
MADDQPVTGGPTWVRKMRTLFRRLDYRYHGYLILDDLMDVAGNIFNIYPKMSNFRADNLVKALSNFWFDVVCAGMEYKAATTITIHEKPFVDAILKGLQGDFLKNFDESFVTPLFVAMDEDEDKNITSPEFRALMLGFKSNERDAELLFKLRSDGPKLSKASFKEIWSDFFFSDDSKSKVNRLFGNLLKYKGAMDYPVLDCGPVWEGKMRTMFRRFDVAQTMKLRCHNFVDLGETIVQRIHTDKKKAENVIRQFINMWVKYLACDKDGKRLDEIREIEFIHNLRDMINGDYRHQVDNFGWTFFKALDIDQSGFISQSTYRTLCEAWQIGREEGEGMFRMIDTNKDGKIDLEEFLTAWNEYFLSEEQNNPYKMFFGPIIYRQTEAR